MKTAEAAKEILALLEEGARRGVASPSADLRLFLNELSASGGLKKPRKVRKLTTKTGGSKGSTPRVGVRPKRPTGVEMAKTIEELANKLRDAFESAASFETVLNDPQTQALSKANVVTLYNRLFDQQPAPSMTKPEIFNAMRRERINWIRGRG
jgi:hypothetical protein